MTKELRDLPNPYDFANPVSDDRLFFGRTAEIADLTYYLNHAMATRKPIHLALVGARASGKTSFLNVAQNDARRRGFCTVRINLNEGDVKSDLDFFRKFLHTILMAAFEVGAYGGKRSAAYFSYLELTATFVVKDLENLSLVSPIQMAYALKSGNQNFTIPDDILTDDLRSIYENIKMPVCVLIDECNVLRENRVILEKLRNIFMNMDGYMLVLAATEDFFPMMDEVFSPIMRQFKRIDIGPFKSEIDVRECITNPLINIGLSRSQCRKLVSTIFVRDIDVLSGRRPYEIQLICHTLFRRCQEGTSTRFSLDLKTIEAIQREIASGQKLDERPIIRSAKLTKRKTFSVLNSISGSIERLSRRDWWHIEWFLAGNSQWSEANFYHAIDELVASGLLVETTAGVEFAGDAFDRLYIKYIARQKGAYINSVGTPFEHVLFRDLVTAFSGFEHLTPLGAIQAPDYIDILPVLIPFLDGTLSDTPAERFDSVPLAEDFLARILEMDENTRLIVIELYFNSSLGACQTWFIWGEPDHLVSLRKLERKITDMQSRANDVGFTFLSSKYEFVIPAHDAIVAKVRDLGNEQLATRLSGSLMSEVVSAYVDSRNIERAKRLAETAFAISGSRMSPDANNVGYLYMATGDYREARLWYHAAQQYASEDERQLLEYNMGVLSALIGDLSAAREHLLAALTSKEFNDVSVVYRLFVQDGKIEYAEVFDPISMPTLINQAMEAVDAVCLH